MKKIVFFYKPIVELFDAPRNYLPEIDFLRAISILIVMIGHLKLFFSMRGIINGDSIFVNLDVVNAGYGVDIFFTISGFLIGNMLFNAINKNTFSIRNFYLSRFLRLAPAYYATICILLLLYPSPLLSNDRGNILLNFLYLSNFQPILDQFMTWSWSLSIEEQFYICFPLLLWLFYSKANHIFSVLIALWIALACAWPILLILHNKTTGFNLENNNTTFFLDQIYQSTIFRSSNIACGILVSSMLLQEKKIKIKNSFAWAVLMVLFSINFFLFKKHSTTGSMIFATMSHVIVSISTATIIFCLQTSDIALSATLLRHAYWKPIARLSYSLYLLHPIAYTLLADQFVLRNIIGSEKNIFFLIIISLITSLLAALLMYSIIEKPFIDLRKKIGLKAQQQ